MRVRVLGCLPAVAVMAACVENSEAPSEPSALQIPVFAKTVHGGPKNFRTHLTGRDEVPANDSKGQGQAIFQLSKDGTEISYKVIVANIKNVTQAHIHCCGGPTDVVGIVVWLYPSAPPSALIEGRSQGVLGEGVITDADVGGVLAGGGIAALLEQIRAGMTYVNVHTSQFGPGEIRGQLTPCRDTSSVDEPIQTVDAFLARVCQQAAQCPGVSATPAEVEACAARIGSQLSQNQLATLERFTTYTLSRQNCILECMRTEICTRFGGSINFISDSDVVEPFEKCEQRCQ